MSMIAFANQRNFSERSASIIAIYWVASSFFLFFFPGLGGGGVCGGKPI